MNAINPGLTRLADFLLAPFASRPLAGLVFWSAIAGVAMTYAFGKTSNQRALRRLADRTRAQLLAVKLFKDDLNVTFRCQVELLKVTGLRLLHSLPPMLVMMVPFVLILTQLAARYEFAPLQPGKSTIVELQLAPDAWEKYQDVELELPEDVVAETAALRDLDEQSISWRLRSEANQLATLRWNLGEQVVEKQLATSANPTQLQVVSVRRPGTGFWDQLLYPGERSLASNSPVRGIEVHHETRQTPIFGINIPWWATFFIVSMIVAVIVRRFVGVQF